MQRACVICGRPSPQSRCPTHRQIPLSHIPGWKRDRLAILERDGWVCQFPDGDGICGKPATHVDHILPRSHGGTQDPQQLRAACEHHNLSKGNRA